MAPNNLTEVPEQATQDTKLGGSASHRVGKTLDDVSGDLLNIKNQLDKMETMLKDNQKAVTGRQAAA